MKRVAAVRAVAPSQAVSGAKAACECKTTNARERKRREPEWETDEAIAGDGCVAPAFICPDRGQVLMAEVRKETTEDVFGRFCSRGIKNTWRVIELQRFDGCSLNVQGAPKQDDLIRSGAGVHGESDLPPKRRAGYDTEKQDHHNIDLAAPTHT
mgnify:FL=1